ncbi:unnamed protein product [Dicrocoelium dendriticum]|nr:unnamed protein product [Dicrocoelium dendriticum]
MGTYRKGTRCDKLWCVWHGILISTLHLFLIYNGITRYLSFKFLAFDPKFGGDWDQTGLNFSLAMLIGAIGSFCLFLFVSVIRTTNYASESVQIGRDMNSINTLSLGQGWRSAIPLTTLPTTFMTNRTYTPGPAVNAGPGQRPHFTPLSGESEDEHASVLAGEETLTTGGIYDTWPRRAGGVNHEALNPYHTPNMLQCIQDQESHQVHLSIQQSVCLLWEQLQRHFFPYTSVLHLLTAYCLLLPIPLVQAQKIYHGALDIGWLWRSDMDFVFGCSSIGEMKSNDPPAAHFMANSEAVSAKVIDSSSWEDLRAISPEFFNLALVFVLLVLRYPSVFWYTSRSFSFLFSLLIFLTGVHALIEYSAASVLVKLAWNAHSLPHIPSFRLLSAPRSPIVSPFAREAFGRSVAEEPYPDTDQPPSPSALANFGPLFLSTLSTLLFLFLFLAVFEYGYHQFLDNLVAYRLYLIDTTGIHGGAHAPNSNPAERHNGALQNGPGPVYNPSESGQSGMNGSGKFIPCFNGTSFLGRKSPSYSLGADTLHPATRCCLFTYAPHMWALVGGLCVLAIKFPLIWDCFQIYRATRCSLLLASPFSGIALLCVWFIAWFAFGLKPAWKFQVNPYVHTTVGPVLHSESGMVPNFQPTANGSVLSPIMMGSNSAAHPTGLGNRTDPAGRLFTTQPLYPSAGPLTLSGNCFIPSGGSIAHTGVPASPTYACYHGSYHGGIPGVIPCGIRVAHNMEPTVTNGLSPRPIGMGTGHDQCADDAEASSSMRTQHHTGAQDGITYQSNSLRPCNLQSSYQPISSSQYTMTACDRVLTPNDTQQSSSTNGPFRGDTCNRSQPTLKPSSGPLIPATAANQCGQRVSFRRNIELVPDVSPAVSEIGSQNNSSDDSGIDNLKLEHQNSVSTEPAQLTKTFGSGPYDNAFPTSVCSSIPVQRLNQANNQVSRTLQVSAATSSMANPSMNDSIYSTHTSSFAGNMGGKLCPSQNLISESALRTMLISTDEMIGDASNGCQCSTSEQFPLLLCPELLSDASHESRLCSQV